jgi:hypothetical protein
LGRVTRAEKVKDTQTGLVRIEEKKRLLGRHNSRWEDHIESNVKELKRKYSGPLSIRIPRWFGKIRAEYGPVFPLEIIIIITAYYYYYY